jgi:hypothetical protein
LRRRGLNLLVNLDNPNIKIKDHISINSFENAMRYIKNFDEMEQIYKRGSILSFLMRH